MAIMGYVRFFVISFLCLSTMRAMEKVLTKNGIQNDAESVKKSKKEIITENIAANTIKKLLFTSKQREFIKQREKDAVNNLTVQKIDLGEELIPFLGEDNTFSPDAACRAAQLVFSVPFKLTARKLKKGNFSDAVYKIQYCHLEGFFRDLCIVKKLCDIYDEETKKLLETKENKQQNINTMQKGLGRLLWNAHHKPAFFSEHLQSQLCYLPKTCLVEVYVQYSDKDSHSHLLEIIHPAAGESLKALTYGKQISVIHKIYYDIGKALSIVHQAGMDNMNGLPHEWRSKFVHGDFHHDNIFYNNGNVYFIDNEVNGSISQAGCAITVDLVPIIFWVLCAIKAPNEFTQLNLLDVFLNGYIEAYPDTVQASLKSYCYNGIIAVILQNNLALKVESEFMNRFSAGWDSREWTIDYFIKKGQKLVMKYENLQNLFQKILSLIDSK